MTREPSAYCRSAAPGLRRRQNPADTVYLLRALVSDFKGLLDVSAEENRLGQMANQADVKKALKRERDEDDAEGRILGEIFELESRLGDDGRLPAMMTLRDRLTKLSRKAASEADTPRAEPGTPGAPVDYGRRVGASPGSRVSDAARAVPARPVSGVARGFSHRRSADQPSAESTLRADS